MRNIIKLVLTSVFIGLFAVSSVSAVKHKATAADKDKVVKTTTVKHPAKTKVIHKTRVVKHPAAMHHHHHHHHHIAK